MSAVELANLTTAELVEREASLAHEMTCYEMADGPTWFEESRDREACRVSLTETRKELARRRAIAA